MKREESFEIGDHGELVVVTSASNILLTEGEPGRIDVVLDGKEAALDLFDITQVGDLVSIQMRKDAGRRWISPRVRIAVSLPAGSDVDIKTASGDILGSVDTGQLFVASASGDARFGDVSKKAKIKTASGDVFIGDVAGDFQGVSASGDFRIDTVSGELTVTTASGDIFVDGAGGRTTAKSASGDITIGLFSGPAVSALSMSGDIAVGLAPGMSIEAELATMSGSLRNNVTPSEEEPTMRATLRVKTMSGDITLR